MYFKLVCFLLWFVNAGCLYLLRTNRSMFWIVECTVWIILLECVLWRCECSKVSVLSPGCMDCVRLCGEYKPHDYKWLVLDIDCSFVLCMTVVLGSCTNKLCHVLCSFWLILTNWMFLVVFDLFLANRLHVLGSFLTNRLQVLDSFDY
jgi:hypothetical protein